MLREPVQAHPQGLFQLESIAGAFEQVLITSADRFEPPLLDRLAGDDGLVDPVNPIKLGRDVRGPGRGTPLAGWNLSAAIGRQRFLVRYADLGGGGTGGVGGNQWTPFARTKQTCSAGGTIAGRRVFPSPRPRLRASRSTSWTIVPLGKFPAVARADWPGDGPIGSPPGAVDPGPRPAVVLDRVVTSSSSISTLDCSIQKIVVGNGSMASQPVPESDRREPAPDRPGEPGQ